MSETNQLELAEATVEPNAVMSTCGNYRYYLSRTWYRQSPKGHCVFIMLNPSTADHTLNDRTVSKCIAYAKRWGFGGLIVLNLFALRSTDPKVLKTHHDPQGINNGGWINDTLQALKRENENRGYAGPWVICAWGTFGELFGAGYAMQCYLHEMDIQPYMLKLTKDGHPYHPLYLKKDLDPIPWV